MAAHAHQSKLGQYRQVRLTFTQEVNGRCSVSVYAKPIGKAWHEHQCLLRSAVNMAWPLNTTEDVLAALVLILEDHMLPHLQEDDGD